MILESTGCQILKSMNCAWSTTAATELVSTLTSDELRGCTLGTASFGIPIITRSTNRHRESKGDFQQHLGNDSKSTNCKRIVRIPRVLALGCQTTRKEKIPIPIREELHQFTWPATCPLQPSNAPRSAARCGTSAALCPHPAPSPPGAAGPASSEEQAEQRQRRGQRLFQASAFGKAPSSSRNPRLREPGTARTAPATRGRPAA